MRNFGGPVPPPPFHLPLLVSPTQRFLFANTFFLLPIDTGSSVSSTKKILTSFAHANSFDPLSAENWYLHFGKLLQEKVNR
jgi:hypothetical protein